MSTTESKPAKLKKCKECGCGFVPNRPLQFVCSPICGINYSRKLNEKKEAKARKEETKQRKEKLKTLGDWTDDLQKVFNQWVRESQKGSKCISCDNPYPSDAGHYRSRGAHPELRFHPDNVHLQCRKCNGYWGGNLIEYRKGLIKKIGVEKVEWLEGSHEPLKLSIPEIKDLIREYREKIKELRNI